MHGRMTRGKVSPERVKEGIADYRTRVAEPIQKEPGFQGCALFANRQTGETISVTYWVDEAAMKASEAIATQMREGSTAQIGGQVLSVETAEIVDVVRVQPPKVGSFIRLNTVAGAPDKIDAAVDLYRAKVVPLLKQQTGFRAALCGVNRESGRVIVTSVWDTAEDRAASEAAVAQLRRETGQAAGGEVKVEHFESVFTNIPAEVAART